METLIAEIKSIAKLVINLDGRSIAIDWPIVTGKDLSDPGARKWLAGINEINEKTKKECLAGSICRDIAETKKGGRTFCLGCDFYPDGIDEASQRLLNNIISESGGRKSAAESQEVIFSSLVNNPGLLVKFDGVGSEKKSSDNPFWLQKKTRLPSASVTPKPKKESDPEKEVKNKKSGIGAPRARYEIKTENGKVISVSEKITSLKIKGFFIKWVRNQREESAELISIKGGSRKVLLSFNPKTLKIFRGNGKFVMTISSRRSLSPPVLLPDSALTLAPVSSGREKLRTRFEEILDLPVEIGEESEWRVITDIDSQKIDENGGAFLCYIRVGKDAIRRGVCFKKDLKKIIQEESTKPIPGDVIIKDLSLSNLCTALNDCIRIETLREKGLF